MLTLPVVETEATQERRGCHSKSRAPSLGPATPQLWLTLTGDLRVKGQNSLSTNTVATGKSCRNADM